MKGGYQILDLTGATAGSPVEVKGIYKAASGNNGKPVLILTNDGQRVYAEIAEDDGDYITTYISAEGKTVKVTIEPDDSVTTVISDPGASITGLEQAVNELNDNKAAKSDITDLECTGTKNTTGNTIAAGRYFYLNGALCKATADIANGATFTLNTNFTVVTIDEELSALNSNVSELIDITNQVSFSASITFGPSNIKKVYRRGSWCIVNVWYLLSDVQSTPQEVFTLPVNVPDGMRYNAFSDNGNAVGGKDAGVIETYQNKVQISPIDNANAGMINFMIPIID